MPTDFSVLEDASHTRKVDCRETEKKAKVELAWQRIREKASLILSWRDGDAASDREGLAVGSSWRADSEVPLERVDRNERFISRVGSMKSPLL